jgi:hypothetical protein
MALLEEQFTEKLQAGASPITYEGNEGQEQQVAQAIWDKLPPQARMQFGSFSQFFSSGAWKKVLAALQQQMQGGEEEIQETETETIGRAPQEGLGALMPAPRPMAFGGIAGLDGRTAYGWGSKLKSFGKSLVGGAKKVLKSPVGKAAAIYGLGTLAGGMPMFHKGASFNPSLTSGLNLFKPGQWSQSNILNPLLRKGLTKEVAGKQVFDKWGGANLAKVFGVGATLAPLAMAATGNWAPDEQFDELKSKSQQFGFDYDQMISDIQTAVESGDEGEVMKVMVKYNLSRGDMPAAKYIGTAAEGGRIGAQEGGLMDLGGMEKDYRQDGGFVPIGGKEKADDVPARLSRNEFVFTADAVRAAGGGDIDQGAEVMENVMKNLEGGGRISEESQGQGARDMFSVSERLSEVV